MIFKNAKSEVHVCKWVLLLFWTLLQGLDDDLHSLSTSEEKVKVVVCLLSKAAHLRNIDLYDL